MKKIIIVNSCKDCPHILKEMKDRFCAITGVNVTKWYNTKKVFSGCELDNAFIERIFINDKNTIVTEGEAVCKKSFTSKFSKGITFEPREEYSFKRQIDGHVRIYPLDYESETKETYYELYKQETFDKFFKVSAEKSVPIKNMTKTCSKCLRPVKWCECINEG